MVGKLVKIIVFIVFAMVLAGFELEPITSITPSLHRTIYINSPADMNVYNSHGVLVASIVGNEPQNVETMILSQFNRREEKIISLPANESYTITLTGTSDGEVSISISERTSSGRVVRVVSYISAPISTGEVFTVDLPIFTLDEMKNTPMDGSSVNYVAMDASFTELPRRMEFRGEQVENSTAIVSVSANNSGGRVGGSGISEGSGAFQIGRTALLQAIPLHGYEFIGWYIDDVLISEELMLRLIVVDDIEVVGVFVPADTSFIVVFD